MASAPAIPSDDTIVAVSTPPGRGGIGIVRLSGAEARAIAEPMLRLRHPLAPSQARFAEVLDGATGEVLDEAVVTFFAAPHSYTTEDVVEIAAHGSPVLLEYLVRRALEGGARLAAPGEFTQRAFLAGRLDLTQAEAVHDLIESSTLHQARVAAQQLGGALSRRIAPTKDSLIALIGTLEAGVDFAEDDIDVLPTPKILARIDEMHEPLAALESTFGYGRVVRDGFTMAIVGRPNAGKSSLFNRLVERDRAIVTATPGTTRDLVTERVSLNGIPVDLVDTAGLRPATDEAESIGIAKSREAMADADLVLLVVDATAPPHPEDEATIAALVTRPMLIALNKCDLDGGSARVASNISPGISPGGASREHEVIRTSALTGEGIRALREAILRLVSSGAPASESALVTNLRQQQAISSSLAALALAREAASSGIPHEMVLLDLYEALRSLDALTGATTTDDILNLIFSRFCIGK
ncbi:tRNA uridine-5-carboxymethylaminomethyl(34) synthesis GTPase MnmE [Edaphobacter bradus]|uniref:tRNA uridine-5-carboxymethylaminomethyl(34) synthesis GTPase MnmE n=1 Tax=Edaphobacter bradus TaxID=2259016 RepID=UPI0021DF8943|nr:tRNA uridine-5-carboxymethylaminomethyl(34) synthesis GTPase MnmE [Edaphobacter bradus]